MVSQPRSAHGSEHTPRGRRPRAGRAFSDAAGGCDRSLGWLSIRSASFRWSSLHLTRSASIRSIGSGGRLTAESTLGTTCKKRFCARTSQGLEPHRYMRCIRDMRCVSLTFATALASGALLVVPASEAKFRITLVVRPQAPMAGVQALILVRTDVALPRPHGIRLSAVGPWRTRTGQALLEVRLRRSGSRELRGNIRFPYPGRWHLDIPASAASPPFDTWVRVRRQGQVELRAA
jgi:hypothetical protein